MITSETQRKIDEIITRERKEKLEEDLYVDYIERAYWYGNKNPLQILADLYNGGI